MSLILAPWTESSSFRLETLLWCRMTMQGHWQRSRQPDLTLSILCLKLPKFRSALLHLSLDHPHQSFCQAIQPVQATLVNAALTHLPPHSWPTTRYYTLVASLESRTSPLMTQSRFSPSYHIWAWSHSCQVSCPNMSVHQRIQSQIVSILKNSSRTRLFWL